MLHTKKISYKLSDAELVRQFTKETGTDVPNKPELMSEDEVFFLIKMMLDEILELGATVEEPIQVKYNMIKMIIESKNIPKSIGSSEQLIGEQGDALVDSYYYSLNAAVKKGINLSKIFNIVHKANMNKRDSVTGKFLKREDGKIIKPANWISPDITAEIKRQMTEGSFTSSEDLV
jgi:predicted HAD superfamily Cof-like phosphohydrolase